MVDFVLLGTYGKSKHLAEVIFCLINYALAILEGVITWELHWIMLCLNLINWLSVFCHCVIFNMQWWFMSLIHFQFYWKSSGSVAWFLFLFCHVEFDCWIYFEAWGIFVFCLFLSLFHQMFSVHEELEICLIIAELTHQVSLKWVNNWPDLFSSQGLICRFDPPSPFLWCCINPQYFQHGYEYWLLSACCLHIHVTVIATVMPFC